jgi:hypothetical protein
LSYDDEVLLNGHTAPHLTNVVVHVVAGSAVIVCGTVAVMSVKGGRTHRRAGWAFMFAYVALVATAVIGVVVFEFRSFLAVATIASSYDVFAGYRALRLRGRRPRSVDVGLSFVALLAPMAFVFAIHLLHKPWSPALTWSVLGGLIALAAYDLSRMVLPQSWLHRVWLQEHLYKMMAAFIAAAATGAATIFPHWAPWSALVPVIAGEFLTMYFLFAYRPSKTHADFST